jgi:hypothetical protein
MELDHVQLRGFEQPLRGCHLEQLSVTPSLRPPIGHTRNLHQSQQEQRARGASGHDHRRSRADETSCDATADNLAPEATTVYATLRMPFAGLMTHVNKTLTASV